MPNPNNRKDSNRGSSQNASIKDSSNGASTQKARLRKELDSLHQEMEVARFATLETGHRKRKVPKNQSKARTRQRKDLEKLDHEEIYAYDTAGEDIPIRGATAAQTAEVINGSLIFGIPGKADQQQDISGDDVSVGSQNDGDSDFSDEDENSEDSGSEGDLDESEVLEENVDEDSDDDELEILGETEDIDGVEMINGSLEDNGDAMANEDSGKRSGKKRKNKPQRLSSKRRRYRLKNFKSFRMAQRHGEALAAHARGNPALAIQKLKAIAQDHPSAPQIYSSLGMIYEEMLQGQKAKLSVENYGLEQSNGVNQDQKDESTSLISLATKMYGSFHVAAYLCTKDYALWERAANAALEIATLYSEMMAIPDTSYTVREYHRSAKVRWLSEAKSDYYRATKLNPPGIDVACKLALTLIQLGHLSEALTLLTDLKNHADKAPLFNASHGAWLLYADLMLQIGHECSKWNSGDQSNGNHMLRRWLRKMSKSFNWEERRLQALVKALEAAAGSNNCGALLVWMQQRASSMNSIKDNGIRAESRLEEITDIEIEAEKQIVLKRNIEELEDFDRVTAEMKSAANSKSDQARRQERENLVEIQQTRLDDLQGQLATPLDEGLLGSTVQDESTPLDSGYQTGAELPISSSCRTVCNIATDLVRQALSKGITTVGKLACESVALYLRERSEIIEKRTAARKSIPQDNFGSDVRFREQTYDIVGDHSDGYTSDFAFSDDDELSSTENPALFQSLRNGSLPPTLQFLYGICLAAEGGKRFLAMRCIESVNTIDIETLDWLNEDICDTAAVLDTSWQILLKCTASPLTRTAAYSLLGDALKRGSFDAPVHDLYCLFSEHVKRLIGLGIVREALTEQSKNSLQSRRRRLVIDVLVTAARFQVQHLEQAMVKSSETGGAQSKELVIELLDSLTAYLKALWNIDSRAAVCTSCKEILSVLADSVRLLLSLEKDGHAIEMHRIISKIETVVSILCGISSLQSDGNEMISVEDLRSIPFDSSFQSEMLKKLSLRVHNCAISTNCSHFSGWERSEFSTALLKSVDIPYFSGISVEDNHTFGLLNDCWVPMLSRQWELLPTVVPDICGFDFAEQFKAVSKRERYAEVRKSMEEATDRDKLCIYGEDSCIEILLSFSELSLRLASITKDRDLSSTMFCRALSIILPLSQFALHQELWTSTLGTVAASQTGLIEWRPITTRTDGTSLPSYLLPTESRGKVDTIESSLDQWFEWENENSPFSNLAPIEPETLLSWWRSYVKKDPSSSGEGTAEMQQLDEALKQLRLCFSEQAIETQSLNVAVKLLEVATSSLCENPFLCISHAARFARHSRKGGTSGDVFKAPLVPEADCSSLDVIGVLGRAGCLQSLYCFHEAAFLYSYVAGVCAAHRNPTIPSLEWNYLWKAFAIFTYNQIVRLRVSFKALVKEHGAKEEPLFIWKTSVIEELRLARADGWTVQQPPDGSTHPALAEVLPLVEELQPSIDSNLDVDDSTLVNGEPMPEVFAV